MVTHFIFMSSSYSQGTRIALDFIVSGEGIQDELMSKLDRIMEECGHDVSISTHRIQAKDDSWESVCEADQYFMDVKVVKDVDEFIKLIQKDRELQGIDVAKYILSHVKCTQLKLQKLVYLCYADYLCTTGKRLFTDDIYAFKYGPVVDTVYQKYKQYGYKPIEKESENIDSKNISEMPSKSRILFARDGLEKVQSIDKTLREYSSLTAPQLVDITHRKKSPWSVTYKGISMIKQKLKDDVIKEFHGYESVNQ